MENLVTASDNAIEQFKKILNGQENKFIRLGVNSGGCSGFTYNLEIVSENEVNKDDVFVNLTENFSIVLDGISMLYLTGTNIDYETNLIGSQFKFSNPIAKAQCGCGTSFGV